MTRAWHVSTVQMEWNPQFLAELLPNMERIYTAWNVKKEPFPIRTVKDNASHVPYVQLGVQWHKTARLPRIRDVSFKSETLGETQFTGRCDHAQELLQPL